MSTLVQLTYINVESFGRQSVREVFLTDLKRSTTRRIGRVLRKKGTYAPIES